MGPKPSPLHTLDRKDNHKGYFKENCRWATPLEQNRNRRDPKNNTSGKVGVSFRKDRNLWTAYAYQGAEVRIHLYLGPSKDDAIAARLAWEKENMS